MFVQPLFIHKDPSAERPFAVYVHGFLEREFTTLSEARQFIGSEYDFPKDPTRFFFSSNSDSQGAHSLDLIVFNVCAEARFVDFAIKILKEKAPQHYQNIIAEAVQRLDLSPVLADWFLLSHCGIGHEFWQIHPLIYLRRPSGG